MRTTSKSISIDSIFSVLNLTPHAGRREGNKVLHCEFECLY